MPRACQIGSLSGRHDARSWVEPKRSFPTPDVVHNAMMPPGSLDMRKVWTAPMRAGSDHRHIPSRGF